VQFPFQFLDPAAILLHRHTFGLAGFAEAANSRHQALRAD
jgi:hypothetical protein